MVKLIFVLKTRGCWINAVETSPAGACGAGQDLFAGPREGGSVCDVTASAAAFGRCLEKVSVKSLSTNYDCSFFLDSLCSLQKLGS